jgi:hypothetical protein
LVCLIRERVRLPDAILDQIEEALIGMPGDI